MLWWHAGGRAGSLASRRCASPPVPATMPAPSASACGCCWTSAPFRTVEELDDVRGIDVRGIGPAIAAEPAGLVTV